MSMLNSYLSMNGFVDMAMKTIRDGKIAQEKYRQRVHDEWQKTFDMPRKMKKKRRKELELDWQIANWDPFGIDKVDVDCMGAFFKEALNSADEPNTEFVKTERYYE